MSLLLFITDIWSITGCYVNITSAKFGDCQPSILYAEGHLARFTTTRSDANTQVTEPIRVNDFSQCKKNAQLRVIQILQQHFDGIKCMSILPTLWLRRSRKSCSLLALKNVTKDNRNVRKNYALKQQRYVLMLKTFTLNLTYGAPIVCYTPKSLQTRCFHLGLPSDKKVIIIFQVRQMPIWAYINYTWGYLNSDSY